MAETIYIPANASRTKVYESLYPQLQALVSGESDAIANIANIMAALKQAFNFWWVGCYFVKPHSNGGHELVLGPFQGPVACTRIAYAKGVCGTAWATATTMVVPDVDQFPGHIACSAASRSEVVVPIFNNKSEVVGVLDVDSHLLNDFSDADVQGLEKIAQLIAEIYEQHA